MSSFGSNALVAGLSACAPTLAKDIAAAVEHCLAGISDIEIAESHKPVSIPDSELGLIELSPLEALLVNTPLLGRLRHFQQSTAIATVYPSFTHTRLQFAIACLGWTDRYLKVLERRKADDHPFTTSDDIVAVRLAALLEPIASVPFRSALWPLIEEAHRSEFFAARLLLGRELGLAVQPSTEQLCAALILLSQPFLDLLGRHFGDRERACVIALGTVAFQLGSPTFARAHYLADVAYGPISAIQIADVVRGSRATGLDFGFDPERFLNALIPIDVRVRAEGAREFERPQSVLGIREQGVETLEFFALARSTFHARVINHPTARLILRMVERFASGFVSETGRTPTIGELIGCNGDYAWLSQAAREVSDRAPEVSAIADQLLSRRLPKPALAFGPAYMAGSEQFRAADAADHRAMVMREVQRTFSNTNRIAELEIRIADLVVDTNKPKITTQAAADRHPRVYIIFPPPNWSGAQRVLVLTRSGAIELASEHFAIRGWNDLYASSKSAGRVFCDPSVGNEVARSARRVFEQEFGLELTDAASSQFAQHSVQERSPAVLRPAEQPPADFFISEPEPAASSTQTGSPYIDSHELKLPPSWLTSSGEARERLARRLRAARQQGFAPATRAALIRLIDAVTSFQAMVYEGGTLQAFSSGEERRLQRRFRDHLRSGGFRIDEGLKVAGGEVDLLFEKEIVIEIKIYGRATDNPMGVGAKFGLQARRYALALDKDVVATFVGYQPRSENGPSSGVEPPRCRARPGSAFCGSAFLGPAGLPRPISCSLDAIQVEAELDLATDLLSTLCSSVVTWPWSEPRRATRCPCDGWLA